MNFEAWYTKQPSVMRVREWGGEIGCEIQIMERVLPSAWCAPKPYLQCHKLYLNNTRRLHRFSCGLWRKRSMTKCRRRWEFRVASCVYESAGICETPSELSENKYLQFAIRIPLELLGLRLFPLRPIKQTLFEGIRVEDFPRTCWKFLSAIASHPLIEAAMEIEARLRA